MKQKVLSTICMVLAVLLLVSTASWAFVNVPVKKISLSEDKLTIMLGKTYELKAEITPSDATNKTVKWVSSDSKIVTVDKNGKVKALKIGKAFITVSSSNGKVSARCSVTVATKRTDELTFYMWSVNLDNTQGIKNDRIKKYIEDKFNVNLVFKSGEGSLDKFRLAFSSGNIPDVVNFPLFPPGARDFLYKIAKDGMLANMEPLVTSAPAKYPVFSKIFKEKQYRYYNRTYFENADNYYAYWAGDYALRTLGGVIFNGVYMKAKKLQMPTTFDEFIAYLKAVKSDTSSNIIPFTFWSGKGTIWEDIDRIFFTTQGSFAYDMHRDKDGKTYDAAIDPKNKEIWKQLAQYYKEGLIDKEVFTRDTWDWLAPVFASGKVATAAGNLPNSVTGVYDWAVSEFNKANPNATYKDVLHLPHPLKGEMTEWIAFDVNIANVISASSKNKELALRLLDWLASDEGKRVVFWGLDGIHYTKDSSGNIKFNSKEFLKEAANWNSTSDTYWPPFGSITTARSQVYSYEKDGWYSGAQKAVNIATLKLPKGPQAEYFMNIIDTWQKEAIKVRPPYERIVYSEAEGKISSDLETLRNTWFTQFVSGAKDVDKEWDNYVKAYKAMGGDIMLNAYNKAIETARERFDTIK